MIFRLDRSTRLTVAIAVCATAFLALGCVEDNKPVDPPGECTPEACGPALGVPNMLCDDGVTESGPGDCERQENGECGWTMVECPPDPEPCAPDECGPSAAIAELCPDGEAPEPADCTRGDNGVCGWSGGGCPEACTVDDCGPAPQFDEAPCEDGSSPSELECTRGETGMCGWSGGRCPPACTPDDCGPQPDFDAAACPDGSAPEPGACERQEDGECGWGDLICPPFPCEGVVCEDGQVCADGECVAAECAEDDCAPRPDFEAAPCPDGSRPEFACERNDNGECGWGGPSCPDACDEVLCERGSMCVDGECVDDPDACAPGEQFDADDGCNTCECPESGLRAEAACTELACEGCRSNAQCADGTYCDFPNNTCGAWGGVGQCSPLPQGCVAGGPGACGCDGSYRTNGCELASGRTDEMRFGGCIDPDGNGIFFCGDMSCNAETDICNISMNDVAGEGQPEFFANCSPLPDDCGQGDCGCVEVPEIGACYDGTGQTIIFHPGG